ncbi:hypothetical protein acsn021_17140 [Anaerocolumna cellulosilytica]|uniref:Uncharacterized protein n=1 Tax=Anaerocolumna cellulosilytica TaxID=433286 RepID=A0A6S6R3U6_9FIRM|nr:non-ribosomal peptide synthetase [Anaerocolumna cellulosilytica]MBB5194892.1 amino acid adenylation domain-containing protein/non-ribosomal peptide synthase protein (TIGR01720 family) [Anaerocolumna cellulosilytica]BCJ94145.1 hypothetical protein acsn021_17140 [Anaerocolumna cellulosilytica]
MNVHPLSNAQKRIWFTQKKYENSSLFNIGGMVKINGNVDVLALKQAISNTILHNPALKLRLIEKNNEIYQYISSETGIVDFIDFSCEKEEEKAFMEWYDEQAKTPFKMINCPLYYFSIFKISDNKTGYFIKLHHIIADGWSIQLLTDQITNEYENVIMKHCENDERNTYFIEEKPSYINFVYNEESQSKHMDKAKKYWNEMYSKMPELSSVPCTNLNGQRMSFIPDDSMQVKIEQYIKKQKISLNTFLIFIYILYSYKKSGTKDIIIGMPLLGRKGKVERQTFGTFTNTMPYRYVIDKKEKLVDILKNISIDLKNNLRYQNYPYNLLHSELRLAENGIGSLYNICVNYYNTDINTTFGGFKVENKEFYNGQQEYALQIIIRHWNNIKLQLDFDFQTDLFSEKQIKDMYQQFIILMNQVILNDSNKVGDLFLIDDEDKVKIIDTLNQTGKVYPKDKTWFAFFHKIVHQKPDNIAISQRKESITYQELDRFSNRIANTMILAGVKKGDVVAVLPEYDIQSIAIIVAIMKCGGVYLPIDIHFPIGRVNEILHNSDADFLIAKENHSNFRGRFFSYRELLSDSSNNETINCCEASDIAYIIYTSGSTGTPKGVMITHSNFMNYLCWAKESYIKLDKEIFALYSSFSFDFTMTSIFLPLISGNEIRIYNNMKEDNIFKEIIEENKATILKLTPSHITLIQDIKIMDSSIHTFIVGGENLKTIVCEQLSCRFNNKVNIYNEYGPTETTIGCMIYLYDKDKSESIPIGKPIANTTIYILDQDMKPVPNNTLGEIYIGGAGVSKGYYRSSKETCKRFLQSPYRKDEIIYKTGDRAYRDDTGNIIFSGRLDNEIKMRGNRINISEIEQKILLSNIVKDVFVKTFQNKNDTLQLCAYIIPNDLFDIHKLCDYLKEHLPSYMIPYYFSTLDKFPLTFNGKINVNKLPEPLMPLKKLNINKSIKAHEILLNVVKDIVNENSTLEDNFYALGGDSIKAIQLSSRLSEQGYELTVQDILSYPDLYDMAYYIKAKTKIRYEQGTCSGNIIKTPIISWFFDQKFEKEGHYNQSILLELFQVIPLETLDKVFLELIRHHDILRLNYDKEMKGLYYNNEHLNTVSFINVINLEGESVNHILDVINTNISYNFDLKNNLLIKPYLLKSSKRCYLYITVHHLVIDGVSWRILLEDFTTLLKQVTNEQTLLLPEKTISYDQYAEKYCDWASKKNIDINFWNSILRIENCLVRNSNGHTTCAETVKTEIQLNQEMTENLLGCANEPYHTKPNELLLIALVQAVNQVFSSNELVLELESHGRDIMEGVNTNRTIGWFTNMYPIRLNIQAADLQVQIKSLKEQIREGVRKGYEYGILKYLQKQDLPGKRMICFNYLGEYKEKQNDYFTLKQLLFDCNMSEKNQIPYLIDVNAVVVDKRTIISIKFDKNKFDCSQIEKFNQCFEKELKKIVEHCVGLKESIFTPTDFDLVDLTQEELDYLLQMKADE